MENASKALIIAGGVLLAIIIVGLMVFMWSGFGNLNEEIDTAKQQEQLVAFNKQYESYQRQALRGADAVTILNKVISNNDLNDGNDSNKIECQIKLVKDFNVAGIQLKSGTYTQNETKLQDIINNKEAFKEFKRLYFECNEIGYNKEGRVNKIVFTQRTYNANDLGFVMEVADCDHEWSEWVPLGPIHRRSCKKCTTIEQREHDFTYEKVDENVHNATCTVCHVTYNESHIYEEDKTRHINETCTEKGRVVEICSLCQQEKTTVIPEKGHTGGTHENGGKCTECGEIYQEHKWTDWVEDSTGTQKRTCTYEGCGKTEHRNITYDIIFDGNTNTGGSTAGMKMTYGTSQNLTKNGFTKTGFSFKNWNTKSNGTGQKFENGENVNNLSSRNEDTVKLYAQWEANTYYLDLNGLLDGSGAGNISGYGTADVYINGTLQSNDCTDYYTQLPYGTRYEIKDIKAVTGHTYNGVSSGSLSGTIGEGAVTVQLKFTTNKYTIAYNKGTATGGTLPQNQTATYGRSIALGTNSMTKSNTNLGTVTFNYNGSGAGNTTSTAYTTYVANGWATSSGGGRSYTNGQSVSNLATGGTFNLYPSFTGTARSATFPSPSRTGYRFEGWYTAANGGSKVTSYTGASNVTYYAHWTALSYTIAFNSNGGSGSMSNQTVNYGATVNLSSNKFTAPRGYTFAGWARTYNKQGTDYTNGQSVKDLTSAGSTITLYAKWYCSGGTTSNCNGPFNICGYCKGKGLYTLPWNGGTYTSVTNTSRYGYGQWHAWCSTCGLDTWESPVTCLACGSKITNSDRKYYGPYSYRSCCYMISEPTKTQYRKPDICTHGYSSTHKIVTKCSHGYENAHYSN